MYSLLEYFWKQPDTKTPRTFTCVQILPNDTVQSYKFYNVRELEDLLYEASQFYGVPIDNVLSEYSLDGSLIALHPYETKKSKKNTLASKLLGKIIHDTVFMFRKTDEQGIFSLDVEAVFPNHILNMVKITPPGVFVSRTFSYRTLPELRQNIASAMCKKNATEAVKMYENEKLGFIVYYFQCDASRHGRPNVFANQFVGKAVDDDIYICKLNHQDAVPKDIDRAFRMDDIGNVPAAASAAAPQQQKQDEQAPMAVVSTAAAAQQQQEEQTPVVTQETTTTTPKLQEITKMHDEPSIVEQFPSVTIENNTMVECNNITNTIPVSLSSSCSSSVQVVAATTTVPSSTDLSFDPIIIDAVIKQVIQNDRQRTKTDETPKRKIVDKKKRTLVNHCDLNLDNIIIDQAKDAQQEQQIEPGVRRSSRIRRKIEKE